MLNRTCEQAGVEDHWCTCTEFEKIKATNDSTVLKVVDKVLNYINSLNEEDAKGKCSRLKLDKVLRAGRYAKRDEKKLLQYTYEVAFSVTPSGGEYEVTRDCEFKEDGSLRILDSKDISRTNLYGNQPHCVEKEQPHLRKYCFCKDLEQT